MPRKYTRTFRAIGLLGRGLHVGMLLCGHGSRIAAVMLARRLRLARSGDTGDALVGLLTALGPSYIKIGQLLSVRPDLLPEHLCARLSQLTDESKPPGRTAIQQAVREAYADREWPFVAFDWTPVASGSIATVHSAVTRGGRRVAVKVRRPGIERVMTQDFELTMMMVSAVAGLPPFRSLPVKIMFGQVGGAILRQLDFAAERASLAALRANLGTLPGMHVPAPVDELCTSEIVVMEFVDDLIRIGHDDLAPEARQAAARNILTAIYQMLFVDGMVHCDLHPGNLYLRPDASLVVLDAGFVVALPAPVRVSFADFFINMAMGNGPVCAQIVLESAAQVRPGFDRGAFRTAMTALIDETAGQRSGEFSMARFAGQLFAMQRRFGVFPVPEFAFPLLSLLVIEGMIQGLDKEADFQAAAMPVLRRRNMAGTAVSPEAEDPALS